MYWVISAVCTVCNTCLEMKDLGVARIRQIVRCTWSAQLHCNRISRTQQYTVTVMELQLCLDVHGYMRMPLYLFQVLYLFCQLLEALSGLCLSQPHSYEFLLKGDDDGLCFFVQDGAVWTAFGLEKNITKSKRQLVELGVQQLTLERTFFNGRHFILYSSSGYSNVSLMQMEGKKMVIHED